MLSLVPSPRVLVGLPPRLVRGGLSLALLLALFALLLLGARQLSYTADEPAYVAGGTAVLAAGPRALPMLAQRGYPPLLPAMHAAIPYLDEPRIDVTQLAGWPTQYDRFANAFVDVLRADAAGLALPRTIFASRLASIWLAILLAALVARWGRALWGGWAGVGALCLLVVDPTFLAHGRLATTDGGVTAFGTAALYLAWRWARRGGWSLSLASGVLLAATMLSKVSGPIWALCCSVVMVAGLCRRPRACWGHGVAQIAAMTATSLGLVWVAYGFSVGPVKGALVLPASNFWRSTFYLTGYDATFFALEERYMGSRWWYFPLAFLIKNPLPLLAVWALGAVLLARALRFRRAGRADVVSLAALVLLPIVYSVVAVTTGMNIGYRHLLPVHPLLHLLAVGGLATHGRAWRLVLGLLVATTAFLTLRMTPNELAYFSVLIGGPQAGYHYLVDSNLDWGQRNNQLEAYLAAHPEVRHGVPDTPFYPAPGRYIIGASELEGVGIGEVAGYAWFRHVEPSAHLDFSFLIYDVPPPTSTWLAQCQVPVLPLDEASIEAGFGVGQAAAMRTLRFDCTQAWFYPGGGTAPGVYALDAELLGEATRAFPSLLLRPPVARDPFIAEKLAPTRVSLLGPKFVLQDFAPAEAGCGVFAGVNRGAVVGGETPPVGADLSQGCDPCALEGPLTFLGTTLTAREGWVDVETWWEVTDGPSARNFSIAAHLLAADGYALAGADGLGVSPMLLEAGDVVVQRHRFDAALVAQARWLRTGAYWLDTMALWGVGSEGVAPSDPTPHNAMLYVELGAR